MQNGVSVQELIDKLNIELNKRTNMIHRQNDHAKNAISEQSRQLHQSKHSMRN